MLACTVVMPDHIHVILKPLNRENDCFYSLTQILKGIKGRSATKINQETGRTGALWQKESFDRIIRDHDEWCNKHEYIRNNPVSAELVENPTDYNWILEIEDAEGKECRYTIA